MIVHTKTKQLLSNKNKGKNNPNYNNHWSKDKRERMSILKKEQYANGMIIINKEGIYKGINNKLEKWKENPELKNKMIEKVRKANTKYKIYQYTKDSKLIKIWNCIYDIIKENPNYKRHNIYAVCSGEKPSIYGYIWVKVLNDDIVQTNTKVLEK